MKKKNAIFFSCNKRFLFTLSTALLSLKKNSYNLLDNTDILIYQQNFTEEDKMLLNKIIPCRIVSYTFPLKTDFNNINFLNFTQLAFARYEIFNLLDNYEKILYMDVDVMIAGDLSFIFNNFGKINGIALCKDNQKGLNLITKNFIEPLPDYDMTVPCYNSGVILFCNNIPRRKELTSWCYKKTVEWLENLVCPDQGVLNIMFQEFGIKIEILPDIYNCLPSNKKYLDKNYNNVLIYHCAGGGVRFWTYTWNSIWQRLYTEYLSLGGKPHTDKEHTWLKIIRKYKLYKYNFFDRSPDPQMHPARFIKYLLNYFIYPIKNKIKKFIYKVNEKIIRKYLLFTNGRDKSYAFSYFPYIKIENKNNVSYKNKFLFQAKDFKQLREISNCYNEEIYILGSGPSIKTQNLRILQGKKVFFLNGSIQISWQYNITPFFLAITDATFILNRLEIVSKIQPRTRLLLSLSSIKAMKYFCPHILEENEIYISNSPLEPYGEKKKQIKDLDKNYFYISKDGNSAFSLEPSKGLFNGGTVMSNAIQIAFYLGFRNIYLLGLDIGNAQQPRFYENNKNKLKSGLLTDYETEILPFMKATKELAEIQNREIYNCSPITKLPYDVIPYFDFNKLER